MTQGISALMSEHEAAPIDIAQIVQTFDDFTDDNDPRGEHDFGAFEFHGQKCFWKIDYYDPSLKWGSEDPANLKETHRVLTIMLTS